MNPRRPGEGPHKTRAGYVIPHQPQIEEFDDPATVPNAVPGGAPQPPAPSQPANPAQGPAPYAQQPSQHPQGFVVPAQTGGYPTAPTGTPDAGVARPKAQPIEVEYIQETDLAAARTAQWPMLEVWTRNRIYHVDSTLICVAVINRATGQPEPNHSLKGTRLTGGERRSKTSQAVEIYYPLPMPGTEAVFRNESKRNGSYGHTSTIERVVLRIRKMRVGTMDSTQAFDEITGRFMVR